MDGEWLDVAQTILTNPNVAYVLLFLGLWALASAITIPGTGFPEAAAVICLLLAAMGLAQLPISVIGLALIAASTILFLVDLKVQSTGLTVVAAIGLGAGSYFLFRPETGVAVSPWLIVCTTLLSVGVFGLALRAAVRAQRMAPKTDPSAVVGAEGVATTDLAPIGTVQVQSELWTAIADATIPAGTPVRVTAVDGVRLHVVPANPPETDLTGLEDL